MNDAPDNITSPAHPVTRRKDRIRVATTQLYYPNGEGALAPTLEYIARAGHDGCDLIAFPEYHLGHVTNPGPQLDAVAKAAASAQTNVIIGAWEDFPDGTFANTAFVFDRSGALVGRYCKTHAAVGGPPHSWPPFDDQEEWHMKLGEGFPVFDLDFGTVGVMTCYDGYFPESSHCLALNGAELIVWINGRCGSVEDFLVKAYMWTGFVHMVTANQSTGAGTMIGTYPWDILCATRDANLDFYLTADLDMAKLREHRVWSRMFHQRRPELYTAIAQRHAIWQNYPDMEQPPTLEQLTAAKKTK